MTELLEKTREAFLDTNRNTDSRNAEYLLISDFGKSSVTTESGSRFPHFRIFTPVKPQKGRKLNTRYMDSGMAFNPSKDSLMDYPTIVRNRLTGAEAEPWEKYNRLVSVHSSRCPLNCWHCYLEECLRANCASCLISDSCAHDLRVKNEIKESWFTAEKIIESFLEQREKDPERRSNILRLTGGEPFLVTGLALEVLREFRQRGLELEVLLWTETNLLPFVSEAPEGPIVTDEQLKEMSGYRNLCIHPCFHGITDASFSSITGWPNVTVDRLIGGLKRLLDFHLDIYPSIGSNTFSPMELEQFYLKLSAIDANLPLRFALIEYDLDYSPVRWRRDNITGFASDHQMVFDRFQVIETWSRLLKNHTGYAYAEIPRHLVPLK